MYVEGKTSQIDEDISKDDFNYNDFKHDTNKDIFLVRTYGQEDDYIPPLYDESDRPREFISFADNKKNMPDLGNKNTDFDYLSVSTISYYC